MPATIAATALTPLTSPTSESCPLRSPLLLAPLLPLSAPLRLSDCGSASDPSYSTPAPTATATVTAPATLTATVLPPHPAPPTNTTTTAGVIRTPTTINNTVTARNKQ